MGELILVSNPGSASHKCALYHDGECLGRLHFEFVKTDIVYSLDGGGSQSAGLSHLTFALHKAWQVFAETLSLDDKPHKVALRIVAPSGYFQQDRILDQDAIERLRALESHASLHINTALQEIHVIKQSFPEAVIYGISDSAFHKDMPAQSANYAIAAADARKLEIKRFGYHGLSAEAAVEALKKAQKLPQRLIVCHLGSGASVTAVKSGVSLDTTMGFSPLEGLMMATRSGSLDIAAAQYLRSAKDLSEAGLLDYLNHQSGLLGVSGQSSDIRDLLELEKHDEAASLALEMYVHRVQQAIGAMAATLGGLDALVFTGTVGERSAEIRKRVAKHLLFLGLAIDNKSNRADIKELTRISPADHPAKIYVIPTDEDAVIAMHATAI